MINTSFWHITQGFWRQDQFKEEKIFSLEKLRGVGLNLYDMDHQIKQRPRVNVTFVTIIIWIKAIP